MARFAAPSGRLNASRNGHELRRSVVNLCAEQSSSDPEQVEKMAIAAAFHDLGIWTDRTFDYLQPSVRLASAHLVESGTTEWTSEMTEMILEHPKWLVEPFRRADWIDVSMGLITFGLPRRFVREVFSTWPSAGFHKRLGQLELQRLQTHPWRPLPMMRL